MEAPPAIAPGGTTPDLDPCAGLAGCVDVDTLPVQWTTGAGTHATRVADAAGPGTYGMLAGRFVGGTPEGYILSVPPFAVSRSDFADATATAVRYYNPAGDLTGDGVTDYIRPDASAAEETDGLVAGPLVGDVDSIPDLRILTDSYGSLSDYTMDGVADRIVGVGNFGDIQPGDTLSTELHPGPLEGWDAPATLRVEVTFAADESWECANSGVPLQLEGKDLDGDGAAETILGGGSDWIENCPYGDRRVIPHGFTGTISITRDTPAPFARYTSGFLVPDQDGDGVQDTMFATRDPVTGDTDGSQDLYSGPMVEVDGWWVPSGPLLLVAPPLVGAEPLWDIDGDGIVDWLIGVSLGIPATEPVPAGLERWGVFLGGVHALAAPVPLAVWGTKHGYTGGDKLVLPEEKALFLPSADGYAVIDLSALEPQ